MKFLSIAFLAIFYCGLSGCAGTVRKNVPVPVKIAVAQPCVQGSRPTPVIPLNQALSDDEWKKLDVRQKAATIGRQGLALKSFSEDLNAATGGCN